MRTWSALAVTCALVLGSMSPAAATTDNPGMWSIDAILQQPDGSIIVGGGFVTERSRSTLFVRRLRADGVDDSSYAPQPLTSPEPRFTSITALPDGRIILTTFATVQRRRSDLIALDPDGRIDDVLTRAFAGLNGHVEAVATQSDGRIILGGAFTRFNGEPCAYLVRLNSDGTRDPSFNAGGSGPNWPVSAIAVDSMDRILVGGLFFGFNGEATGPLVRLHADGHRDTSFTVDASVNLVQQTAVAPDGGVVFAGSAWSPEAVLNPGLMRVVADGGRDLAFEPSSGWEISSIESQPDGKILLVYDQTVLRLLPDGRVDAPFMVAANWQSGHASAATGLADGRVLFGSFTPMLDGMYADGRRDRRWSRPGTFVNPRREPSRPAGLRVRRTGKVLTVRWKAAVDQVAYTVDVGGGILLRRSAATTATSHSFRVSPRKDVRVCVRAYNVGGASKPRCLRGA